ncbi:MAG: chromate transporter [Clostridia bacterium]|nr:chromate transporter [Clostridia bacterium]
MLLSLFFTFFKIGLFTFGGGYAMIANVREVVVEKYGWITEDEFFQMITIAESTPGPIAINMATYVGYRKKGVLGSALATLGVILPSLIIIYAISQFLDAFMANRYVAYAFLGIKAAVAFLILKAGTDLFRKLPKQWLSLSVFLAIFVLMILFELFSVNFSSIFFILIGGILGILAYAFAKSGKEAGENQ